MITAACSRAFHHARAHDPDLARLRGAARSTLSSLLTASLGVAWATHHDLTPIVAVPGALFAMIAPLFLREPRWSGWLVSLLVLCAAGGCAFVGAAALAGQPALRAAGALTVVFAGMLCQTLGARAVGAALLTLVAFYLGLYLHPSHAQLMTMLVPMMLAPCVVTLVGRVLIPVERGGAAASMSATAPPLGLPPLHHARALTAWARTAAREAGNLLLAGRAADRPLAAVLAHRLHRLAWRPALAATLAALLAMLAGGALSEERSMWAVISTFVVFLGTTSHQGTRARVGKRIVGTLAGAAASVLLITAFGHLVWVLVAAMVLSVFGWAYYILHAYARGVFFITTLVGVLYGALGAAILPLATLRIEEVFAGCLISLAVAVLLMPSGAVPGAPLPERP